ncbi:MAG: hypothetical protein ACE1ZA_03435 [Pseudomonadales bacterium]
MTISADIRHSMMVAVAALVVCVALFASLPTVAHSPDRARDPLTRHEGIGKRAGLFNIEFVAEGACASVYVYSKSNVPISVARSVATITSYLPGGKDELLLEPNRGNRLYGCSSVELDGFLAVLIRLEIYAEDPVSVLLRPQQLQHEAGN